MSHTAAARPRVRRSLVLLVALLGFLGVVGAAPASAESPMDVADEITDTVGALEGRTAEVQSALDELSSATRYQLFVVFVSTFEGEDGLDWANATATASGLGVDDILLAVAVDDSRYGISVDDAIDLTDDQLDAVAGDVIEPELQASDWAGAAIAGAQGYLDAALGGSGSTAGSTSGSTGSGSFGAVLVVLLVVGLVVVVIVVARRSRGRSGSGPRRTDATALPTAELSRRASAALVELDDAIKTSEQELGFAQAQFGIEATRAFTAVLAEARSAIGEAFRLRQRLDDAQPETEPEARAMMLRILELCSGADSALDSQAEEFDRLRDLQNRAPQVLAETRTRADEVDSRLAGGRATLATLATTYPPTALASVAGNVDQAASLLDAARASVDEGLGVVDSDRAAAVALVRAAEDAVEQAVLLLDAVDRARGDLTQAGSRIEAGIASLSADLADAARLAPADPAVGALAGAARTAIAAAADGRTSGDPLALLARLTEAEAALDAALAPARAQAERDERGRAQLATILGQLTSQIRSVSDFIESRRGAVGAEARTRLAEAARLAQEAERTSATDVAAALTTAQRAMQLATSAQQLAQADVSQWQSPGGGGGAGGINPGTLVLGGIILDQVLRGGGRRGGFGGGGFGGGFGGGRPGGGFGGGRPGGGRSSGSFGGGGTRGRRGGGGRF
ncbi:TPM domain-containing protein [Actinotalea sp.]|uniref:TPM domain-containing protein n=1 Tax=Actinotalea sp. TaxID=1872145 RepID=UPI003561A51A